MKVLIAEDEEITLKHLLYALEKEGHRASGVPDGIEALSMLNKGSFDLLLADIKMPRMNGLTLLSEVKDKYPDTEVIMITGFGTIESAVDAMKRGATDYITKPFNLDELLLKLRKIQEKKHILGENIALKVSLGIGKEQPFIAKSRAMKKVTQIVQGIAGSDCNVLITGESGVGKGLVAKLIHYTGLRKDKPFLALNCAVFAEELLASELFGHEKGAFTGAVTAKQGLIGVADTGTLFLD